MVATMLTQAMNIMPRMVLDIVMPNALVVVHILKEESMVHAALKWISGKQMPKLLNGHLIHALDREISNAQTVVIAHVTKVDVDLIHMH